MADRRDIAREGNCRDPGAQVLNDIRPNRADPLPNETIESSAVVRRERREHSLPLMPRPWSTLDGLGDRRNATLTSISHQDILAFIERREEAGVAPKTRASMCENQRFHRREKLD
jgi:hypothetical protein